MSGSIKQIIAIALRAFGEAGAQAGPIPWQGEPR
jgi:hypothetical protein